MSKSVRRVLFAAQVLLLCSWGSCYVGDRQYENEVRQIEMWMEASDSYASHFYVDTNVWQYIGFMLCALSISVAIAAFVLWRNERG